MIDCVELTTFAETHGLDYGRLRRFARTGANDDGTNDNVPGAFKFGKTWAIESDADVPVLPDVNTTRIADDGMDRYVVRMDDAIRDAFVELGGVVIKNATVAGRERRAQRKMDDATDGGE